MALIKRIVTGQTFGNWLDTTNKMIDDLNAANAIRTGNRLVRYDGSGSLSIKNIKAESFHLDANADIKVNSLSTDYSDTLFHTDNTLFTAKATYDAIKAEAKNIIKNAAGHAVSGEFVKVNTDNVETRLGGTQYVITTVANTTFNQDVIVEGDLQVKGDSTEFTTQVLNIQDNNIVLNKGGTTYTAESGGFDIEASNAFFRLVDSGNRFPYAPNSGIPNEIDVKLNIFGKRRNFYLSKPTSSGGTSTLGASHFYNGELVGAPEDVRNININTKDQIVFKYTFDSLEPTSNLVPIGIGTSLGANRESNVIEPSDNYTDTANSLITYQIGSSFYSDYATFKADFIAQPITSADTVKITFNPDQETNYYYWAGLIPATIYFVDTQHATGSPNEFDSDIFLNGSSTTSLTGQRNYDFDITLGDEIKISHDLSTLQEPVFIGIAPFTEDNLTAGTHNEGMTATRANTVNLINDSHANLNDSGAIEYQVDNNSFTDPAAYYTAAKASTGTANVIFRPSSLKYADQYQYYYWNTANNYTANNYGGEIRVSANNTGMGGEIETLYPMGLYFEKQITQDPTYLYFAGVQSGSFELDAGDTLKLTSTGIPIFVADNATPAVQLGYQKGVTYEADGNLFKDFADYNTYIGLNAGCSANVIFTPYTSGDYTYQTAAGLVSGVVKVKPKKSRNLSSFSLSTDNKTATIENPRSFNVTKNHNPILELDGNFADFGGTKSGLQLPVNALSVDPIINGKKANGVIRYNDGIGLFEGFTGGTWRGLGGVIDLDQDTQIHAGDTDNTLYFEAFANTVAEMRANGFYLTSNTASDGVGAANTGTANVFSNWNLPGRYEVNVEGDRNYPSAAQVVSGKSRFEMNPDGIKLEATGYLKIPVGDMSERPPVAENGMIRYSKDRFDVTIYNNAGVRTSTDKFDAIELYKDGSGWQSLSYVTSEYNDVADGTKNYFVFSNCLNEWSKQDLDVYVNGLRVQKTDYVLNPSSTSDLVPFTRSSTSPNIDNVFDFESTRAAGQVITVVHRPSQTIGAITLDTISRTEFQSGSLDVVKAQTMKVTGGSESTSPISGALIVDGGLGVTKSVFAKSITETSSLALKENISNIQDPLGKIRKLNGVEFSWIDEKGSKEFGMIAEEVQKVTPQLVSNSNGAPQGVKYSKVVALLVEAVKQQQEQIEDLKSQLPKKRVRKTKS